MGKQRIAELLTQLRDNQSQDVENAAAIYTVAQVAVNALDETAEPHSSGTAQLPASVTVSKAELLERYGSFNGCRRAAKELGIRFPKTPSWSALEAAFSYHQVFHDLIQQSFAAKPNKHLAGVTFEITLKA